MIQLIKRQDGEKAVKETFEGIPQIGYNNYGHITLRVKMSEEADALIVLNQQFSAELIEFCKENIGQIKLGGARFRGYSDNILDDLPF